MPTLLFNGVIFIYPVINLLSLSVIGSQGNVDLTVVQKVWATPLYWRTLMTTFETSAWTVFFSILAAYPVAYLIARLRGSVANLLFILVLVPFWTSFLVRVFAWMIILGQHGAINSLLLTIGLVDQPLQLIFTEPAVVVAMVHSMMPLAIIGMVATMRTINPVLGMAAQTLGSRDSEAFWRIYFPLSLPGVAAAGLIVLVTGIGFFIAPAMLGSPRQTMITQILIYAVQDLLNWPLAGVLSIALLLSTALIFLMYDRVLGLSSLSGEVARGLSPTGRTTLQRVGLRLAGLVGRLCSVCADFLERGRRRRPMRRGAEPSVAVWVAGVGVILFLILPALILVPVALNSGQFLSFPPEGISFRWFIQYLNSPDWLDATYRSLIVAVTTGILATILGTGAAYALAFAELYGRSFILLVLLLPMIIPQMIFAIGLFRLLSNLGLVGTLSGLTLGHTAIALPYVLVTMLAVFKTYDTRLDQAAWTLGADRWRALYRIMIPQIYDGLIASFLFAFVTSFDNLTVSLFVSGGLSSTLPRQMWSALFLEVSPILAAVSTIVLVLVTVFVLTGEMLRRRATH